MKPVRLGVVGCGVISHSHLKLAKANPAIEVVAVADLIRERADGAAREYEVPKAYYGDAALLKDDRVDAVVLAMPTGDRTPVAYKALKRGKHVLLEKPVAATAAEVRKMMALRGDRVVACCSSRYAFSAHAAAATKCVASGVLGDIRLLRIRAVHGAGAHPNESPPPWRQSMARNGGGILVNWSCYELNYLMDVVGWRVRPRHVMAGWWPVAKPMAAYVAPDSDADSHYTALIRCDDGIMLSMERAEFSATKTDCAWEIIGTEGALHMSMQPPGDVVLNRFVPGKGIESETIWNVGQGGSEEDVVNDFVRAISEGTPVRTGLEQALIMQKITDAIYKSTKTGGSVMLKQEGS